MSGRKHPEEALILVHHLVERAGLRLVRVAAVAADEPERAHGYGVTRLLAPVPSRSEERAPPATTTSS